MLPVRLLLARCKVCKLAILPRSVGRLPDSLLLEKSKTCRAASARKPTGIRPENSLLEKFKVCRPLSRLKVDGMLPANVLPLICSARLTTRCGAPLMVTPSHVSMLLSSLQFKRIEVLMRPSRVALMVRSCTQSLTRSALAEGLATTVPLVHRGLGVEPPPPPPPPEDGGDGRGQNCQSVVRRPCKVWGIQPVSAALPARYNVRRRGRAYNWEGMGPIRVLL